jgi:fumarylacetoacetase
MALGKNAWSEARQIISEMLRSDSSTLKENKALRQKALIERNKVNMVMPVDIGDYTDFYSSKYHASNVGTLFRGRENALTPNWLHLPVGYHGRASSVVISGTNVIRPKGQIKRNTDKEPIFAKSERLDFELEMGFLIGPGNNLGEPIAIENADEHIFGLVLVNDWSARDIQKWEYVPLGPFNAKNFITSISPWIVTLEALEPFRIKGENQNPKPLSYLQNKKDFSFDITLEVFLNNYRISESNFKYMYWTMDQQLAHHTITGCNLRTGDLLASGTISGPEHHERGCMLELSWHEEKGSIPIKLPNNEKRTFLEDNDEIVLTGYAQGNGYRVGFGQVSGKVLPNY